MGLFSFTQEIAIDLGTANTIIIHKDKIVIDEPSVVALDTKSGKLIAVGERAREMQGKENEGITTVRPLKEGVIGDFNACVRPVAAHGRVHPLRLDRGRDSCRSRLERACRWA